MSYEVIVVGGGIGGLTTAALLSARGVNVCLFERESAVGGCVANFQHLGYVFEPTGGLYSGWESGGIHERIFAQLPIEPPAVRRVSPSYVVRMPDRTEIRINEDPNEFEDGLRGAFPECADAAVGFYRGIEELHEALSETVKTQPPSTGTAMHESAAMHLTNTSPRFRSFIEAQLQMFLQCSNDQCAYLDAAATLMAPRSGFYGITGGAEAVALALRNSIQKSGGTIRLNTPVLRLAYDPDGHPSGVTLLSGETVNATCAIVSNLTIWDTYGKLVGLRRTPKNVSIELRRLQSSGAYLMFLAMDQSAGSRLSADHFLLVPPSESPSADAPRQAQFFFAAAPEWDPRAPDGYRAVTVWTWSDVDKWFTFHQNAEEHEKLDQENIQRCWGMLHDAMPELGDSVEVIETATPQNYYQDTRRKLGMVGRPNFGLTANLLASYKTIFPNLFLIGDTISHANTLAQVSQLALGLSDHLTDVS
jgi:phytoene dehydrogenase-like protein